MIILSHLLDLLAAGYEESILIEIADNQLRDLSRTKLDIRHVELPEQVIVKIRLSSQGVLDRRSFFVLEYRGSRGAL